MKEEEIIAQLSHSYFDHILRDVQPFLEYFDHDQICHVLNNPVLSEHSLQTDTIKSSDTSPTSCPIDSQVVERLFFMACLNSIDISLPFNYSKGEPSRKIKKYEWLTDVRPFGSKSKQGVVNKSLIFDTLHIVIKRAKTSKFDEITLRDFCVGINLNKILNCAPFFVRTLGCFQYKNQFHIATEFIDGVSLKEFLQSKGNTFAGFLNIFFQILLGLEIAQNKLNFSHYDLHTDNVILVKSNQTFEVSLYGYNYLIKHDSKPVMIDFGLSSVHTKGQTVGQKSLETKGIYHHLSPGYDIYVFLLFCIDVVQTSNISIFKGITDLLLFFKNETNLSMDILTNNHIKSLKKGVSNLIPYKFIQYLSQNYSSYLNVDIEPKKYNEKCPGNRPLFLKLKQILDTNDELQLEPNVRYNKGFVKSLMNNIKIYYWYKEKIVLTEEEIKNLVDIDQCNLQNLIDDLNLQIRKKGEKSPSITIEQKNLFFVALDYYYLILELKLDDQYDLYNTWLTKFRDTFVYKNISKQLGNVLYEERTKRVRRLY